MTASTACLEVDDTLQLVLVDAGARLSIQFDRDRALQVGATLMWGDREGRAALAGISETAARAALRASVGASAFDQRRRR